MIAVNDFQMRKIDINLSADERKKLHQMASDIKSRVNEIEQAKKQGKRIGRSADDFLAGLRKYNKLR